MADNSEPKTVKFHYLKSATFKELHCDGAYGGRTPSGGIWMSVFSERGPIPREAVHELLPTSEPGAFTVGPMLKEQSQSREGIVRILETLLYMDLPTAELIHTWLGDQIRALKEKDKP